MKREDIIKLLVVIQTAYPRFYINQTTDQLNNAVDLWLEQFKQENPQIVVVAVKELIATSTYPPSIADVKQKMYSLTTNEVDNMTLWNELDKAVRNCLYNTQEVFNNLSPIVKKFVGNPAQLRELALSPADTFATVTKGQFLKQVDILKQREKENNLMLPETRQLLAEITSGFDAKKLLE